MRCLRALLPALAAVTASIGLLAPGARAAGEPPLPVESFFRDPDIVAVELSPSGRRIAVSTSAGTPRIALSVVELETGKAMPVAKFGDADVTRFEWVNDDRLVYSIDDRASAQGERLFWTGLFSVMADGSEPRMLVNLRRDFLVPQRMGKEPLNWDHELLAVPNTGGNEVIVGQWRYDAKGDPIEVIPMLLDTATQRTRSLAIGKLEHVKRWLFDRKGEPRLAVATHQGRTQYHWRAPGDAAWKQLDDFPALELPYVPRSVDADGQLFVTTGSGAAGERELRRFDFAAGKPAAEALVRTPGFDFNGRLVTDPDTGRTLGIRVPTDAETTAWFDARLKKVQAAADARFPGRVNRIECRRCSSDDMVVLVYSWSDQDPGAYWVHHPARNAWVGVGPARKGIEARSMATLDLHRIKARDGRDLPVWVTLPPGAGKGGPRPAVVLVHGGPWVRGVSWRWSRDAQFLASRGYVVIEPEFRGSTGYGLEHYRAGWKQWGRAMQDDVADATLWAVAKGIADGGKVCIAGASYGGYATLMGLIRHGELYRCGVAWVAVTDPRLLFGLEWVNDMPEEAKRYSLPTLVGDPVADAQMLAEVAPVELSANIKSPLLMAFGGRDRRVPLEHGRRMRDALQAVGREPEWVVYDAEGHGWIKPENRYDFARRMESFLARHLK